MWFFLNSFTHNQSFSIFVLSCSRLLEAYNFLDHLHKVEQNFGRLIKNFKSSK